MWLLLIYSLKFRFAFSHGGLASIAEKGTFFIPWPWTLTCDLDLQKNSPRYGQDQPKLLSRRRHTHTCAHTHTRTHTFVWVQISWNLLREDNMKNIDATEIPLSQMTKYKKIW